MQKTKKKTVIWVKCSGEAHDPKVAGGIDHCWECAPYWEIYPVCPTCHRMTKHSTRGYYCKKCKKHLESTNVPAKEEQKTFFELFPDDTD